jgi:hypothetical protein
MKIVQYEFYDTEIGNLFDMEEVILGSIEQQINTISYYSQYSLGVPYINLNAKWGQDWKLLIEVMVNEDKERRDN